MEANQIALVIHDIHPEEVAQRILSQKKAGGRNERQPSPISKGGRFKKTKTIKSTLRNAVDHSTKLVGNFFLPQLSNLRLTVRQPSPKPPKQ